MPPPPRLRLAFFGTAELAVASLHALAGNPGFELVAVVTQPDKPRGRDLRVLPTPVKAAAAALNLPVEAPMRCREPAFLDRVRSWNLDLAAVAAYGQILPPALLALPRFGFLNVHASLLPKYRGAAPIQWAILNGDVETGVTIMQVAAGLDTGDMLLKAATPIDPTDDAQTLHERLADLGAQLLLRAIPEFVAGRLVGVPQSDADASYARKIVKEDGQLDWRQPAPVLWNRVRGLRPWPGAYAWVPGDPQPVRLKVWRAEPTGPGPALSQPGEILVADRHGVVVQCGAGALRLLELQREGGRRLPAGEFLAGWPLPAGTRLGSPGPA